jgi:predicted ATPase
MTSLRDVVFEPGFGDGFSTTEGFVNSLLRFSEAEKVYREGGVLFGRLPVTDRGLSCSFSCTLDGFSEPHTIDLDFTASEAHPYRLICFVGKNGTGKSGTLSKLATSLSGWELHAGTFSPGRPTFSRVICVSYTVFQPFEVPFISSTSYRYCGLRDGKGAVDIEGIANRTLDAIRSIHEQERTPTWLQLLRISDLFGPELPEAFSSDDISAVSLELNKLSSGQRMVVSIFTELVAHISKQSLVLLDEPETYLHPTLLSTFLRLIHALLKEYDSYAIAATHSPIVVQEIPSRSVRVFERQGSIPMQSELPIESLGANLTEIVDSVFVMNEDDKNYKSVLKEMAEGRTMEELESLFEGRLTLNASAYLLSLKRKQG